MSVFNEALEWRDRAEQARQLAGLDPAAKQAVIKLADSYERLARAAITPTVLRRRELARHRQEGNS